LAGHTIVVAAGIYDEQVFLHKGLIIRGAGPELTQLDGGFSNCYPGPFDYTVLNGFLIEGFTITNPIDKGVWLYSISETTVGEIRNNIFRESAYGIDLGRNCQISIHHNLFLNNRWGNGDGDGVLVSYNAPYSVTSTIVSNTFDGNYHGIWVYNSNAIIRNNILVNHTGGENVESTGIGAHGGGTKTISYNDVWGNDRNYGMDASRGPGDISMDPLFVDSSGGDFHLQSSSPCIDAGDPADPVPPGDGSRIDMGAYEYTGEAPNETVDLSISEDDITFSDPNPEIGETVTIEAVVHGDPGTTNTSTNAELIFEDDFEDGTLNKWILSSWNPSGILEVTNRVSRSDPYSMHAQSDPGTNTGPYVIKHFDTAYSQIEIETWFYLPQKSQEYDQFAILKPGAWDDAPGPPVWDYNFVIMLKDDDYSVDLVEVTWDENDVMTKHIRGMDLYDLAPQTWHHVVAEITDSQITVKINDNEIFDDVRYDNLPIDCFAMGDTKGSSGGWGDAYWDDVSAWTTTENQTTEPGLDATCTVSFYLDTVSPDNLIYREFEVFVPGGGSTVVSHDWVADVTGSHSIIVDITDSDPSETDLTNNTASKDISISEPQGKLKVKASSDKQKYVTGVDDHADIIVKITYQGEFVEGATVSAWVLESNEGNVSVSVTEASPGIFTGTYFFTDDPVPGTYRIKGSSLILRVVIYQRFFLRISLQMFLDKVLM
jgi:parallel beta-helix repeat protein